MEKTDPGKGVAGIKTTEQAEAWTLAKQEMGSGIERGEGEGGGGQGRIVWLLGRRVTDSAKGGEHGRVLMGA